MGWRVLPKRPEPSLLVEFQLEPQDETLLDTARDSSNRLGLALLLLGARYLGYFPSREMLSDEFVARVAGVCEVRPCVFQEYAWEGRLHRLHRSLVRSHLGIRPSTRKDREELTAWLVSRCFEVRLDRLVDDAAEWMRERRLEVAPLESLRTWARGAHRQFEEAFDQQVVSRLTSESRRDIKGLLRQAKDGMCPFDQLRAPAGRPNQSTLVVLVRRLQIITGLRLDPNRLFQGVAPRVLTVFEEMAQGAEPWRLRRYSEQRTLARAAVALCAMQRKLTDDIVLVFLSVHSRNWKKARAKTDRTRTTDKQQKEFLLEILKEVRKLGREGSIGQLFDELGEERFDEVYLMATSSNAGLAMERAREACDRYRRVARKHLHRALSVLEFETGNPADQELLEGLRVVMDHHDRKAEYYPHGLDVPQSFVTGRWTRLVQEQTSEALRIRRLPYETCVLSKLDEALRSKRVWVRHAHRFRNPEQDLPQDWPAIRQEHFAAYSQPSDGTSFVRQVREEMEAELLELGAYLRTQDRGVDIVQGKEATWKVPAIVARPERPILTTIKDRVGRLLGGPLNLSDALLEAHRQIDLTRFIRSSGQREVIAPEDRAQRLLVSVFGLGTNLGIKRIHGAASPACSYRELLYFTRRYLSLRGLDEANIALTNRILEVRDPDIWPDGMKVASDGKHLAAWSGNTVNEYNPHYAKYGVMAYWHIETNSLCVHVDLKNISRSEVTSMLKGIVRHDTEMAVASNAVDSLGQSELGFAVCRMLGVELRPRLKRIKHQKLYLPDAAFLGEVPELEPMVRRGIRWDQVEEQYDAMSRVVAGIARGTGPVESILRRYNRYNASHPTYKGFRELGKALKTVFLCRYLRDKALRSDIHDALNVAENWNSVVDFVFYGRQSRMSTNDPEQMRKALGSLRLLQNSLVLVNTQLVQRVLREDGLIKHMTEEDHRALTPLFTHHVNACGRFNMSLEHLGTAPIACVA